MDGVASSIWDCSAGFAARRGLRACGNPDQPPRSPALGKQDGPPRYSAPDVSPADPCNKMTRSCTVPARKALFFPIFNTIWGAAVFDCDPTVPGVACNLGVLRGKAAASMDPVTLK